MTATESMEMGAQSNVSSNRGGYAKEEHVPSIAVIVSVRARSNVTMGIKEAVMAAQTSARLRLVMGARLWWCQIL